MSCMISIGQYPFFIIFTIAKKSDFFLVLHHIWHTWSRLTLKNLRNFKFIYKDHFTIFYKIKYYNFRNATLKIVRILILKCVIVFCYLGTILKIQNWFTYVYRMWFVLESIKSTNMIFTMTRRCIML